MSGIFDRLTRGWLGRSAPDATSAAPGSGSGVEADAGAGPHDPSPATGLDNRVLSAAEVASPSGPLGPTDPGEGPSREYSPKRDASEDPEFGDGSPGRDISEYRRGNESGSPERDVSEYRRGNESGSPERDIGEYRRGNESGSPERDISEYRRGNDLPPRQEGGLAYQANDVVAPEPPESAPIHARMTDTVAGSEADAGIPVDEAGASVADAAAVDLPLGTADMLGTPTESASTGETATEGVSLNFGEVETEYSDQGKEGTTASVPGRYDVQERGEGSRDADEPGDGAPPEVEAESGGLAYRSDAVVADSPESRPVQARMSDTVAEDEDTKESTDDADSSDKGTDEPPAVDGGTDPLHASDASSLDGGGAVEDDEIPLTLMDFKVTEDDLPAVIEDTGADLGTEALPDLGELGVDEDDAPPVE